IVDRSADLGVAAERIAYGKLLNAGQTCIAPDYALVPSNSVSDFATRLRAAIERMYGTSPSNKDYTSIISEKHYARLQGLVDDARAQGGTVIQSGDSADGGWKSARKFPPTVVTGATPQMKMMQE